jgi:glutamyl-tRNA reductase
MGILVLGISHREAPLSLRERLAINSIRLPDALRTLAARVREGVVLSTCNRTEVYAVTGHERSGREALVRYVGEATGVPEAIFGPLAYHHWQEDGIRHLFRVAAGLDSMILGEPQILGQVREAFAAAMAAGRVGPVLGRLFQQALQVGKAARSQAGISRGAASVSFAAVELARDALCSLEGRAVLVIGAGKTGDLVSRTLRDSGAGRLLIANRSTERAEALAERWGGEVAPFDELAGACARADIVVSCTSAPSAIISAEMLRGALRGRPDRPLLVIDLAVPRDVEPDCARVGGVRLYDLDDLQARVSANLAARRREAEGAERIVEREVVRFMAWRDALDVTPTIRALIERAESIRSRELERALERLGEVSSRERDTIEAMSRSIVNKLLHDPIIRLKRDVGQRDGSAYARAVQELFCLDEVAS